MTDKNDDFEMDRIIGEQLNTIEHLAHENERLTKALDRQCANMAFILNHIDVKNWYDKFQKELEEDRNLYVQTEKNHE